MLLQLSTVRIRQRAVAEHVDRGEVLFAPRMLPRKAGLMGQPFERAEIFLTNFDRGQLDFDPIPGFRLPPHESDRWKSLQLLKDLRVSTAKSARVTNFSLAYVTRVTYKTGTLHSCAGSDRPHRPHGRPRAPTGARGGSCSPLTGSTDALTGDVTIPLGSHLRRPDIGPNTRPSLG